MADEIQKLKKDIALKDMILFVGAGVSAHTTNNEEASHWKGLFKDGLRRCHQLGAIDDEAIEIFFKKFNSNSATVDDYFLVIDLIKCCFPNGDIYIEWLQQTIGALIPKAPELIEVIGRLDCPIITTNCDALLENVLHRKPLTWNNYYINGIENSLETLNNFIFHIHGYIEEPESMTFGRYIHNLLHETSSEPSNLGKFFSGKTLIFIGYEPEIDDISFSNLLNWIDRENCTETLSMYRFVTSQNKKFNQLSNNSLIESVIEIAYGHFSKDLLQFIRNLKSFIPLMRGNLAFIDRKESIRTKYLNYLIHEYGHVSIIGYSNNNISLPLESVYVELKFDPTHPSLRAMKLLEVHEEFKRKLVSLDFFTQNERAKLNLAIIENSGYASETIYKDFMVDQWLNVLLSNKTIFTDSEVSAIKRKVNRLKQSIVEKNNIKEAQQYQIQQACHKFKNFIILGHPGSGKTTLSKWLVTNMAKQCLQDEDPFFDSVFTMRAKIPILIPIWKCVDQLKLNENKQKKTLLQFIYENPTFDSTLFNDEERNELSYFIMESLIDGNVLVIFEGLDEVPAHVDRSDLMKEINTLLERGIDYDMTYNKLTYSIYEQKEVNNTRNPNIGNRFIVTSRIEGNYFDEINFYVPRLTIEDMSNEALKLFCSSYMKCIKSVSNETHEQDHDRLYNDITKNNDIFKLAINPQLASVIAAVYNQCEDKLPDKRIDLYEKAIEKMIERLVNSDPSSPNNSLSQEVGLNAVLLWSIMQEIAEYLHSKVQGLSERILREIVRKCLVDYQTLSSTKRTGSVDSIVSKLVDIFKYQAGLLSEFGQNSFRFIHRTFQEYLAAKSIIFSYGTERSEDCIYENITSKIGIPNWRVPLSMTFGILSKLNGRNGLFNNILTRLLKNEEVSSNVRFSTSLIPFVIIDSLNDMYFSFENVEYELIQRLADVLLFDYKNMSGFSRLKEHQELIHSYFSKLKLKYESILTKWFIEKLNHKENLAPCANIIYQLKWYSVHFHDIYLENLHYDSAIWNWSIDSLLQFYSNEITDESVITKLKFKREIQLNTELIEHIVNNHDWLCVITAVYGGYKNYNVQKTILQFHEIAQFLGLTEVERAPFVFYYQEVWGREDPAYQMAVHVDTMTAKDHWIEMPRFDSNNIYKESLLTNRILDLLRERKPAFLLIEELRQYINNQQLNINEKTEASIALAALGDFDFLYSIMNKEHYALISSFSNRIEQLIYTLKDSIARWSSHITNYLHAVYNAMKTNQLKLNLNYSDYCKIYLSFIVNSGGLPINTKILANATENIEDKLSLYAERFARTITGAADDFQSATVRFIQEDISFSKPDAIMKSFLKLSDAVQMYKPVRTYPWPIDLFTFKSIDENDVPIAFFNCLENMHRNASDIVECITVVFFKQEYFIRNPNLIPLFVLLHYGIMSQECDRLKIYESLLPEIVNHTNKREFLFEKIQSMCNVYYKSRALYQLAEFYDEKSLQLLNESFALTQQISDSSLKFQVLEKIFSIVHYKEPQKTSFIEAIINGLISSYETIDGDYNRVIASIRLSFYGSGDFRKKYLTNAIETLSKMDDNDDDKIKLIIKLKPIIILYEDLQLALHGIINNLTNKIHQYFVNSNYGKILLNDKFNADLLDTQALIAKHNKTDEDDKKKKIVNTNNTEIQAQFTLFAQLNDIKLSLGKTDDLNQLWIQLYKDVNNESTLEKILKLALDTEIILTPSIAMIIDEFIRIGKEDNISILLPYIIKPSNEVLPIVHRWFTQCDNIRIKSLAALLLVEAKRIFEIGIDTIVDLLKNDNDQMRYRAQRVFQHPERDVQQPAKRISTIGEKALMKILQHRLSKHHLPRVRTYFTSFFYDLLWDDPSVFRNLANNINQLRINNSFDGRRMFYFNIIKFINEITWSFIMQSLESPQHPSYVEELFHSSMSLTQKDQITEENWTYFSDILSGTDKSQFREQLYLSITDMGVIEFIIDDISTLTTLHDETYFEIFESKLISQISIKVEDVIENNYNGIKNIGRCNFYASKDLNETILNRLNNITISIVMMQNLIQWLIRKMMCFKGLDDTAFSLMICDCLLCVVSGVVQKEDYLYRKITNSSNFNKLQMIKLLERMLNHHPYFPARGNAFVLLLAMDHSDYKVIINAMNALLDENIVKEYLLIGIPFINLSPNDFLDDLLESLRNESAIKAYEILKIFTQLALTEKLDANGKSKIINYLANEIGQLKSKKLVNYYYTDIQIPFTTTLEYELYKAWIKIQGLSGKTQYSTNIEKTTK